MSDTTTTLQADSDQLVYGAPPAAPDPFDPLPSDELPVKIAETLDAILSGVPPDEVEGYRDMARMYARSLAAVSGWDHVHLIVNTIRDAAAAMQAGDDDLARQQLATVEGGEALFAVLRQYGPDAQLG